MHTNSALPHIQKVFDAVPFYPEWLYKDPGTPLYFLQQVRDHYISTYNDPIVQEDKAPHFMAVMFAIEVAFQLPVSLYSVFRLAFGTKSTTGPYELLLLVYAAETAFSSLLCFYELLGFDSAIYSIPHKNVLLYQMYAPWIVIRKSTSNSIRHTADMLTALTASLLFVDMYYRLYSRVSATDDIKKNQ